MNWRTSIDFVHFFMPYNMVDEEVGEGLTGGTASLIMKYFMI